MATGIKLGSGGLVMAKKRNKRPVTLQTLFQAKQKSMLTELRAIRKSVYHPPTMGSAGQKRWRELLREYLPNRYQVDEAHVIDSEGKQSEQIDLVIYDHQYASLAVNQDGILYVPAESVYAAFEIKQDVTKEHLNYAGKKIESVRKLKRTSVPVLQISGGLVRKVPEPIFGGLIAVGSAYTPAYGTAFLKNWEALKDDKHVNLVFTLEDGLYGGSSSPQVGLVEFLYVLLSRLQQMGNAPAIDFEAYIRKLR